MHVKCSWRYEHRVRCGKLLGEMNPRQHNNIFSEERSEGLPLLILESLSLHLFMSTQP